MDANRCLDDLDKDFQYKYSNDSHKWIVDYPDTLKPDPNSLKISSKNETYTEHDVRRQGPTGRRKKLLEAFYRQVISEEVLRQLDDETITVEEYMTDYMDRYKNPDDMPLPGETLSKNEKLKKCGGAKEGEPKPKEDLEELKSKYPLYLSTPLTFFSQTTGRTHFRKNSTITKSPDQNYDNIEY